MFGPSEMHSCLRGCGRGVFLKSALKAMADVPHGLRRLVFTNDLKAVVGFEPIVA